ncbi:MAG: aminoglycoside phosphotransferase family protein [Rhodospirillaceae bacterium]|nr:aminoglycoside phosphotransferase family protein [Rhodospirillaceae bacterium]
MTAMPTEKDAADVAARVLRRAVLHARRFPTGEGNFVFDMTMVDGDRVVVRMNTPEHVAVLKGAVHWSVTLRPLGVPLPSLLFADLDMKDGPFPFLVMERFPGTDLGDVYRTLWVEEKRALARTLAGHQRLVGGLPSGKGYGFALGYDGRFPHATWPDVVASMIDRSRRRVAANGIVDPAHVERVAAIASAEVAELAGIAATPFLHDITTKNVIVHQGRLSGIVDVDDLCFGDPGLTIALTRMALLARGWETDYIDFWCEAAGVGESRRRLDLYTAIFAIDFMAEVGHRYHTRDAARPADMAYVARLIDILGMLLSRLAPVRA